MAERVVAPDADKRETRLDGGDECGRACVGGTVMTDFKDIGTQIDAAPQQKRLRLCAGIAHKEEACSADRDSYNERIFVAR